MAVLLAKMKESYDFIFYDLCDYRTRDLFPSPIVLFIILPSYVYFSKILGPRLMKDKKPFKLRNTILVYNIFQICICGYLIFEALSAGWFNNYSWICQPVDMTENPNTKRALNTVWWYTVVKLIDLMDTVFFVLRKKDRQISFLHVFHHFGMPIASYIGLKYYPNGHGTLVGLVNCIVHVVMYTYYLISGLGPKYQKYLWWKKSLTTMQLVQFGIFFIHNLIPHFIECDYPRWISTALCIGSFMFLYMFGNFYYVTYVKNGKKESRNGSVKAFTEKSKVK